MAFAAHLLGRSPHACPQPAGSPAPRFVRTRMLGTEALYELLDEHDGLVTAEVLDAPGLAPGTRVRMLTAATRAMEAVDPAEPLFAARLAARVPHAAV
jgi:hypothetical protein